MSDNDVSVVRGYTFTSVGRANDAIRSLWIALDRREAVLRKLIGAARTAVHSFATHYRPSDMAELGRVVDWAEAALAPPDKEQP